MAIELRGNASDEGKSPTQSEHSRSWIRRNSTVSKTLIPRTPMVCVMQLLDEYCASLQPGDRVPSHRELVRRFNASERTVLRALERLYATGKIVRRQGAPTIVTDWYQNQSRLSASSIAKVDSRTVVAIANPDQSVFDRCISLLFRHVEAADLSLMCRLVNPETSPMLPLPPADQRPLGFILFRDDLSPLAKQLQNAGCRVVVVGAPPADVMPEVPHVHGDHEYGGYLATRHLIELGHRRLVFCAGDYDVERTLRWRGHQRALQEARRKTAGIQASTLLPHDIAPWKVEAELAAAYFRSTDAPTGVIAWNDQEAASLLQVLTSAGIRVPGEISVVGYDDLPEVSSTHPPLTTVDQRLEQQLQAALNLLTRPVSPSHTVLAVPTLVCRGSSAHAPELFDKVDSSVEGPRARGVEFA